MEDVYGTALGRTFYQRKRTGWHISSMRLLILTKVFALRILEGSIAHAAMLKEQGILTEERRKQSRRS